jgi:spore coat protein U-like protein
MAFGIYTGTAVSSTSSVTVQCTNTTPYTVGLDKGLGSGASVTNRLMTNGSATLGYALFSDTARTVNWGQTSGTDTVAGTGSGSVQTLTVYGKIAGSLYVTPGSYTDTITASITY